eukprot:TRINITY_DN678_c2_g2_i1.p1 TRINITY_DN678_c2_g2~~TRINITY_DN678_c2_g2_i1.p1  ORF type:complete len:1056 (+),score=392.24 TRINITY_DN678_c2_g2_i1:206-3373(+)
MSDAENVRVAVRVRPFNKREIDRSSKLIIDMQGKSTWITNPENGVKKQFTFDYSYFSHDPSDPRFATQEDVFNDLGIGCLENAEKGYNVSLFAYGQTGSGKSYSMVGYGDPGIIPRVFEELFCRIEKTADPNRECQVKVSMLEIYMEKIRDLLNPGQTKPIQIRDNPKTGPYVENLSQSVVHSYEDIQKLMDEGEKARTIAATKMNQTSSRAHTVFTIIYTQTENDPVAKKATQKVSKINLVDLAGSERQKSTEAQGQRLKEGIKINLSLTALGNCIKSLAAVSSGKKEHIPYRDSVLTMMLKESLGGNAKTVMVAALSPADINYDETLSTLRYADRAKQIKNRAVVNEDPNVRMIKELKAEIEKLRGQLGGGESVAGSPEESEELRRLREEHEEYQKLLQEFNKSDEEKEKETELLQASRQQALMKAGFGEGSPNETPHFLNLNEDPHLSETLLYFFSQEKTRFGKRGKDAAPDVPLGGLNIEPEHCVVELGTGEPPSSGGESSRCLMRVVSGAKVFVNGNSIEEVVSLHHDDRVIIGTNHFFRFVDPKERGEDVPNSSDITWEMAMKELNEAQGRNISLGVDASAEIEEMQKKFEAEKKAQEEMLMKQKEEFEKMQAELEAQHGATKEEELAKLRDEYEQRNIELAKKLKEQEEVAMKLTERKKKEQQQRGLIEQELLRLIPMIAEANQMSDEFHKDMLFELKLITVLEEGVADLSLPEEHRQQKQTKIQVIVKQKSSGEVLFVWDSEKFAERSFLMRDLFSTYQDHMEEQRVFDVPEEEDPFHDSADVREIGKSRVLLQALAYLLEHDVSTPILDHAGKKVGELKVRLNPLVGEDDLHEDVEEMKGEVYKFEVVVEQARGLPKELSQGNYVTYTFFMDEDSVVTPVCEKKTVNPPFNHRKTFEVRVTDEFAKYLDHDSLQFTVFGRRAETIILKGGIHIEFGEDGQPIIASSGAEKQPKRIAPVAAAPVKTSKVEEEHESSSGKEEKEPSSTQVKQLEEKNKSLLAELEKMKAESKKKDEDMKNELEKLKAELAKKDEELKKKKSKGGCVVM